VTEGHGQLVNARVTVAVPTIDRPEMLRRAVDSVISQTYRDWELIVSDNAYPEHGPVDSRVP